MKKNIEREKINFDSDSEITIYKKFLSILKPIEAISLLDEKTINIVASNLKEDKNYFPNFHFIDPAKFCFAEIKRLLDQIISPTEKKLKTDSNSSILESNQPNQALEKLLQEFIQVVREYKNGSFAARARKVATAVMPSEETVRKFLPNAAANKLYR